MGDEGDPNGFLAGQLREMLQQTSVSALASVSIPEFSAAPGEDVLNFLHRFETATLLFSDDMRCLGLYKALTGPANTWARNNLDAQILGVDWLAAKAAVIQRFAPPDQDLRLRDNLARMKFDPAREILLTFAEQYADIYRRIQRTRDDQPDCLHWPDSHWPDLCLPDLCSPNRRKRRCPNSSDWR